MSNSNLVCYTKLSPNYSKRTAKIDTITIHHMAGNLSVESCGNVFATTDRQASSNYGVGSDGRVGLYVEEKNRAWTSSNRDNDNRAITLEVANDGGAPDWHVSDKALQATIDLCVDICKRNGIARLNYTGDKSGNLTMHKWFASTACPGPYLGGKFPYIAEEVNKRLGSEPPKKEESEPPKVESPKPETKDELYRVRQSWADAKSQIGAYTSLKWAKRTADNNPGYKVYDASGNCVYPESTTVEKPQPTADFLVQVSRTDLNIRKGPGYKTYASVGICPKGVYTIVETKTAEGYTWGKLKSGRGWIALEYTTRL